METLLNRAPAPKASTKHLYAEPLLLDVSRGKKIEWGKAPAITLGRHPGDPATQLSRRCQLSLAIHVG